MNRILVTRRLPGLVLAKLDAVGNATVHTGDGEMPADMLLASVVDKHALVTMFTDRIDRDVFDRAPHLKIVANVAVGYNNIDVAYALARGVVVTNTPEVLTEAVADLTWAMILGVTRRLAEGERIIRRGEWKGWAFDALLGTALKGKRLGLVGFGRIGRAVAARAAAFGVKVAYYSRHEANISGAEAYSLDKLLNTSDVVSLHLPLTSETRHLIDRRALARMKRSAYLINTSRGPIVDEDALAWALQQRLIAGAALDVYENEPTIHPGLLSQENVLLVPHLGSATGETRTAMAELAIDNVIAVLSGAPPLTPVQV